MLTGYHMSTTDRAPNLVWMIDRHSSPSRQNRRHFADDIFKRIFLNENVRISIQFSWKFVPKGLVDNKSALFQVMACRLFGDKPLSEPVLTQFTDTYAALAAGELISTNCYVSQHLTTASYDRVIGGTKDYTKFSKQRMVLLLMNNSIKSLKFSLALILISSKFDIWSTYMCNSYV